MVHVLSQQNSIVNTFISEIRDASLQRDRMRFRRNMERIGEVAAYELSKKFKFKPADVTTSLGIASMQIPDELPVVATILRAGLPLQQGVINYLDGSDSAFISAYRRHHKDGSFDVHVEYVACPKLDDRVLIICDPMLATGQSMVLSYKAIIGNGKPKATHIVSAIACSQGIEYIKGHLPAGVEMWVGAVDEELTAQSYIVPGLGDAGDLSFGEKQ